ncbi:MAG TPA: ATP-binding protein [Micromonosporaceae bacterium]|nr:ATP-binding protein [Micromonosporaceae bacterium]
MLRSFRVANHKSIRAEQELSLLPVYDKGRPVLPVAGVFGANASGKSNLLDALSWMRTAVNESYASWKPGAGVARWPFRLDPTAVAEPSLYSTELVVEGVRQTYGFEVDDERVRQEWLYTYPHNRKRIIFERQDGSWSFGSTVAHSDVEVLRRLTRDNALFLSVAGQSGLAETAPAYSWFGHHLLSAYRYDRRRVGQIVAFLDGAPQRRRRLVALTRAADLGLADIRVRPTAAAESSQVMLEKPDLEFLHGGSGVAMRSWEQSQGTLEWLALLVPALTALEKGSVLCVDELDASLHSRLTPRLIELFRSEETNPAGAQLIFTTHDATLLGTSFGEDILARDEVWFVEKDRAGATTLFSYRDFRPREGENIQKKYLSGTFGAVPMVSEWSFRSAVLGTGDNEAA